MHDDPRMGAKAIAIAALKANTVVLSDGLHTRRFLLAGSRQYKALWARDFAMASLGALELGLYQTVRDSLEALFSLQRPDGLLPRGIDRYSVYTRVASGLFGVTLEWGQPFKGWYRTENGVICGDSNLLLPWIGAEYFKKTQDREFLEKWYPIVEKALAFMDQEFAIEGLLGKQPPFSDWADSIARTGHVAITNIFYILALRAAREWAQWVGKSAKSTEYAEKEARAARRFRSYFFDEEKGVLKNFEGNLHLTADANLFAVVFRIVSREDSHRILEALRKSPLWSPIPGRPTWPSYEDSLKSRTVKWANLRDYHDNLCWLWITALGAVAERELGNVSAYENIMNHVAAQIYADQAIYEVYDIGGEDKRLVPVKRLFYRAESPFTWAAGMYLWAELIGTRSSEAGLSKSIQNI